jgi:hypothetical protein
LRARARFHAHDSPPRALEKDEQRVASELGALNHGAAFIKTHYVENILAKIYAVDGGISRAVSDHGQFLLPLKLHRGGGEWGRSSH